MRSTESISRSAIWLGCGVPAPSRGGSGDHISNSVPATPGAVPVVIWSNWCDTIAARRRCVEAMLYGAQKVCRFTVGGRLPHFRGNAPTDNAGMIDPRLITRPTPPSCTAYYTIFAGSRPSRHELRLHGRRVAASSSKEPKPVSDWQPPDRRAYETNPAASGTAPGCAFTDAGVVTTSQLRGSGSGRLSRPCGRR